MSTAINNGITQNALEKIDFSLIQPDDEIVIETNNSSYHFAIVDPAECRGNLSGGKLGAQTSEAVLVASVSDNDINLNKREIQTHHRALFYLCSPDGYKRLVTSEIVHLKLARHLA